jgi:hypothetical protein
MRTHSVVRSGWAGVPGTIILCALLALPGCGLDDVDIPELDGPSTFAANLSLKIEPDLLVADGRSTALVTAQFFDQNGRPAVNRPIFFTIADEDGQFAAIGNFPTSEGPGFAVTVNTDGGGVARVVYQVPPRTDATADQTVLIAARPIGNDAAAAIYKTVRLELRSAEPRMFPPAPGNAGPSCALSVEAPSGFRTNVAILFTTRSFDPDGVIIRYEWFCGSGTGGPIHSPDVACVYRTPGGYTVTQIVTDDDGAQATCGQTVTIR